LSYGGTDQSEGHYNKMNGKAKVKRLSFKKSFLFLTIIALFLFPVGAAIGQEAAEPAKKTEALVPRSELDRLKAEWEAVREQQVQMIREKEDQLEKLKEEIFSRMKIQDGPPVASNKKELEAQKDSLQADRLKFFVETSRQKESLRQLQAALDEKTKQFEAERSRFEQEKKTVAA